jgi:hypothetical protein
MADPKLTVAPVCGKRGRLFYTCFAMWSVMSRAATPYAVALECRCGGWINPVPMSWARTKQTRFVPCDRYHAMANQTGDEAVLGCATLSGLTPAKPSGRQRVDR